MSQYPPLQSGDRWSNWQQPPSYPPQQNTGYPQWQEQVQPYPPPLYYPPQQPQYPPQQPPMYPPPQQPQYQLPKKPRGAFKLGIGIGCGIMTAFAIVVVVIAVLASAGSHNSTFSAQQTTAVNQSTVVPQATTFSIGETATNGTWSVTVNSVQTNKGDQIFTPASGDTFLVVDVTVSNLSSTPQLVSSVASFTLKDSTGQAYNEKFTDIGKPLDGTIQPGDKLRGQLVYEVATSQRAFEFQFQGSLFDGNAATWNISI